MWCINDVVYLYFVCLSYNRSMKLNDFSPFISTPTGIETPDAIELRKEQRKEPDRALYQVGNLLLIDRFILSTTFRWIFSYFDVKDISQLKLFWLVP